MSASDSPNSTPISSGEIETPRGGFMARPGLKAPPRHAVVVRGGDAPISEHIPVARPSLLPPPPPSLPPESLSEKITLRAIPTPRLPAFVEDARLQATLPRPSSSATATATATATAAFPVAPSVLDSAPPPSDAPVVASVTSERTSSEPRSRRGNRSWLTIWAAALAGLVLGIISVVTTVRVREASVPRGDATAREPNAGPVAAAAPAAVVVQGPPEGAAVPLPSSRASGGAPPAPVPDRAQDAQEERDRPAAPRAPAAKRTIF